MLKEVGPLGSHGLVTISMDDGLPLALEKMEKEGIRHLPVVDGTGRVIGILSDRDLKRAMRPDPHLNENGNRPRFSKAARIADYMSWPAQGVDEHTPVGDVVRVMLQDRISSLLILVGPSANPVGIVTTDDLLRFLLKLLDEPGQKSRLVPVREFFDQLRFPDSVLI